MVLSCASDNTVPEIVERDVRIVVGDFPVFGETQTRTVGTADPGKTSWIEGDELLVCLKNTSSSNQKATLVRTSDGWEIRDNVVLQYKEGDSAYADVFYAPDYEWCDGFDAPQLRDGHIAGMGEYIQGSCNISDGTTLEISFDDATRSYSRLRIATIPNASITAVCQHFTPVNAGQQSLSYSLTSDEKGNAYLYGKFDKNSSVIVKYNEISLSTYTFTGSTDAGKSYALDAVVISLDDMDSTEIMETVEAEVERGNNSLRLMLSSELNRYVTDGIIGGLEEAVDGSINLTLIGGGTVPNSGFKGNDALKSIYLPNVTQIGTYAFAGCSYLDSVSLPSVTEIGESAFSSCGQLMKVTFGNITQVHGEIFDTNTGYSVDLMLSGEQKVMTYDERSFLWTDSSTDYMNSDDHLNRKFLGCEFKSVTCGDRTY